MGCWFESSPGHQVLAGPGQSEARPPAPLGFASDSRAPADRLRARTCGAGGSPTGWPRHHRSVSVYPNDILFVTALARPPPRALPECLQRGARRARPITPSTPSGCRSTRSSRCMREHVQSLPSVELRFDTTLPSAPSKTPSGVVSTLQRRRTARQRESASHYLVGADGSRSTVRELIGAKLRRPLRALAPLQHRVPRAAASPRRIATAPPSCTGRSAAAA